MTQSAEEKWRKYDAMEVRLTAPLSERMIELAGLRPGMRVLDLATGRGEPAIRAAQRVAPGGSVLGVDLAPEMLAMARERAQREGVTNLELRVMAASSLEVEGPFDATLARWGLMYMDAPVAALDGAGRVMNAGAPLVAAVFAEPERASYYTLPRRALALHRPVPPIDFGAPGMFRYADVDALRDDLRRAELRIEHVEELDLPIVEVGTPAELVAWVRAFGMEALLAGLPEPTQRAWEDDLVRAAEPLRQGGLFRLGAVTRIVVARPS